MIGFNTYLFLPTLCIRFSWFLLLRRASSTLCLLRFLHFPLFPFHFLQLVRQFLVFFLQLLIIFRFFCLLQSLQPRRWLWRRRRRRRNCPRSFWRRGAARASASAPAAAATSAAASSIIDDAVRLATAAFAAAPVRALACALPLMFWRDL